MPRFAANLAYLFLELPFLERFAAAAAAGFEAVEFPSPYDHPPQQLAEHLARHNLRQVLLNLPMGNAEAGDRGLAAVPGREVEFAESLELALEYARALDCPHVHVMAGIASSADPETAWQTYIANLRLAADRAADDERAIVIEMINTRDMPGYFLHSIRDATRAIDAVHHPNLGLLLDVYHCQVLEGDLAVNIRNLMPVTRHMQIAGTPERHEPDVGEINYPYLFRLIDSLGYRGWIGCEYRPLGSTRQGLLWFEREQRSR